MNERIKQLRKELGLTLEKFGERLGVSKVAISLIENGKNALTDQMLKSICREFNVREEWLRTGAGEMFVQMNRDERVADIVKKALASDDEFVINTFAALGQLTPAEWDLVKKFINTIKGDTPPAASSFGSSSAPVKDDKPVLKAAHMNPGATQEQIDADNALMESDDF